MATTGLKWVIVAVAVVLLAVAGVSMMSLQPPSGSLVIEVERTGAYPDTSTYTLITVVDGARTEETISPYVFGTTGDVGIGSRVAERPFHYTPSIHTILVGFVQKDFTGTKTFLVKLDGTYIGKGSVSSGERLKSVLNINEDLSWSVTGLSKVATDGSEMTLSLSEIPGWVGSSPTNPPPSGMTATLEPSEPTETEPTETPIISKGIPFTMLIVVGVLATIGIAGYVAYTQRR